ncbi:hypothetical protein CEXT_243341 [Caerostris extrusa]|uniref:Uncharacterized protein n=1 Tax=Caerostris extrusa TaxID=172846 RepID=A0AAV4XP40_CAEEX|nr:hypothetical protein CEXT_243341 [Caerostris extrusa]
MVTVHIGCLTYASTVTIESLLFHDRSIKPILKDKIIQFCSKEITLITLRTLLFAVNCFLSDPPEMSYHIRGVNRSSQFLSSGVVSNTLKTKVYDIVVFYFPKWNGITFAFLR